MKQSDDIGAIHAAALDGSIFYLSAQTVMILAFNSRLRDLGVSGECVRMEDWE